MSQVRTATPLPRSLPGETRTRTILPSEGSGLSIDRLGEEIGASGRIRTFNFDFVDQGDVHFTTGALRRMRGSNSRYQVENLVSWATRRMRHERSRQDSNPHLRS